MSEGNDDCSDVLVDMAASVLEEVHGIEVNGELAREHHEEEEKVENDKWLEILLVSEDCSQSTEEGLVLTTAVHAVLNMFLDGEDLADKVAAGTAELLNGHVGTLLLANTEVPVGRVVVLIETQPEQTRDTGADGRSIVIRQPAAHGVHQQHPQGHDGHGEA